MLFGCLTIEEGRNVVNAETKQAVKLTPLVDVRAQMKCRSWLWLWQLAFCNFQLTQALPQQHNAQIPLQAPLSDPSPAQDYRDHALIRLHLNNARTELPSQLDVGLILILRTVLKQSHSRFILHRVWMSGERRKTLWIWWSHPV